ncbi:MAG: enoyl-CoA hydratase, partial [Betaproteobacteria bacterium]
MDDILLIEVADGVATVTLNRPRQMNALSSALRRRFGEALAALGADDAVRAVVITGAGEKAFTAGVDLKELETAPLTADELGPDSEINRAFRALGKPTVAAVNGFAITGGLEIAINCDILVASTNARFADTHARVGIVPGWGMSQLLPRLIGPVRARYMSYTGNFVDAATAKDWGLVLDVLPPGELLPYCRKLAGEIASCDRATLADIRLAINGGLGGTLEDGLALEGRLSKAATQRMDREG